MCAVADFRFGYCGWRKAHPKLDKFNETMLERPLCKVSLPRKSGAGESRHETEILSR
jgi:hypothetical protein